MDSAAFGILCCKCRYLFVIYNENEHYKLLKNEIKRKTREYQYEVRSDGQRLPRSWRRRSRNWARRYEMRVYYSLRSNFNKISSIRINKVVLARNKACFNFFGVVNGHEIPVQWNATRSHIRNRLRIQSQIVLVHYFIDDDDSSVEENEWIDAIHKLPTKILKIFDWSSFSDISEW